MTDTPRTDAIDGPRLAQGTPQYHTMLGLARDLERELAEAMHLVRERGEWLCAIGHHIGGKAFKTVGGTGYDSLPEAARLNAVYAGLLLRAVQLAKAWIEHENSQDMGWVVNEANAFLKRSNGANCGFHPEYVATCQAIMDAISAANKESVHR